MKLHFACDADLYTPAQADFVDALLGTRQFVYGFLKRGYGSKPELATLRERVARSAMGAGAFVAEPKQAQRTAAANALAGACEATMTLEEAARDANQERRNRAGDAEAARREALRLEGLRAELLAAVALADAHRQAQEPPASHAERILGALARAQDALAALEIEGALGDAPEAAPAPRRRRL